jgi:cytochrome P450
MVRNVLCPRKISLNISSSETSAHVLSFALIYLALYPEIQEKIYQETLQLWPDNPPCPDAPSVNYTFLL